MWFRQLQVFQLTQSIAYTPSQLAERLEPLAFKPCLPSMPTSMGFVPPVDADEEDAPLARGLNQCVMVCLQIEDKILPASVVNESVKNKIKQIETNEARKIRKKEKVALKEDTVQTLLPRAFTKFTRLHAYIDTKHQWLILNNVSPAKTELFLSMIKKVLGDGIEALEVIKPSLIFTQWLKQKNYPEVFSVEPAAILQDPEHQHRVIRCQQQDLFASSIQDLIKDGCEVIQLSLNWHDRLQFTLAQDFTLRSVRLAEDDTANLYDEIETKHQKFDADLVMMAELLRGLFTDLFKLFVKQDDSTLAKAS